MSDIDAERENGIESDTPNPVDVPQKQESLMINLIGGNQRVPDASPRVS